MNPEFFIMVVDHSIGVKDAFILKHDAIQASEIISQFATNMVCIIQPANLIFREQFFEKTYLVLEHPQFFM